MARMVKLLGKDEMAEGEGRMVDIDGRRIALFKVGGEYHAVENTCPHRGGPLGEGTLEGTVVTCPWHGRRFDLVTGASPSHPELSIETYHLKMELNDILVELD
jgi:nitrite reductase/ring-hydroxylating ferredoxin subunit